jgi:threonine-phosphate decarboxylase
VMTSLQKERNIEAVFLCNPNSPTGQVVTKADLLPLIDVQHRLGGWIIVDEAFGDFAPDHSLLDVVPRYPRLLILRSCTKFYSIPGLRLGYLVGHPAALRPVQQRQAPWSVNAPAQTAAVAAFEEAGYAEKSLSFIEKERRWVQATLQAIPGVHVFPSAANFLLLELPPARSAGHVAERLRETGILIRDCSHVPGLNARTMRIAIKRRRDNERLCRSLQTVLHG